jgi:hypothetical protein
VFEVTSYLTRFEQDRNFSGSCRMDGLEMNLGR